MSATIMLQEEAFRRRREVMNVKADEPVEVVEEAEQVEAQLYEALLLVIGKRTEDLRCVVHVVRKSYSAQRVRSLLSTERVRRTC